MFEQLRRWDVESVEQPEQRGEPDLACTMLDARDLHASQTRTGTKFILCPSSGDACCTHPLSKLCQYRRIHLTMLRFSM